MIEYRKPKLVAEIGCNHKGDFNIAKEMIDIAAKYCKVDAIKFQKRDNRLLLSEEQYNMPHPNQYNSYGETYGKHREALEFTIEQHKELKEYCESLGIIYGCSVWDINSTVQIADLSPSFIKIPSAQNNNIEILRWLTEMFEGKIHISLGMTTLNEFEEIYNFIMKKNRLEDILFYACTSAYPVDFKDICLLEISDLKKQFEVVGFSGHHLGIAPDIAAYTLGAEWIERHFTLDRTWKGTDHAASLEPDGMRKLKRDLLSVYEALKFKNNKSARYNDSFILEAEKEQRKKLKFVNLEAGKEENSNFEKSENHDND